MRNLAIPLAALALAALASPVSASNGGDRTPAGGAFMSSYGPRSANRVPDARYAPEGGQPLFGSRAVDVPATGSIGTVPNAPRRR